MYRLIITAYGDNEALHRLALQQAVQAVKRVNTAPVHRAYVEKVEDADVTCRACGGVGHVRPVPKAKP